MSDRLPSSSLPTLRQLQFLAALRAEGSFVAAAYVVGVTQPTLSAGIKELEAALGTILVDRGKSGAVLTPAGEVAADGAARALDDVADLVREVRGAGEAFAGVFRLGAIPTIAPFLLPRALPLLKRQFPKLNLHMREDLTGRLVDALRARRLDAALIALPYVANGIATSVVVEDEFYFLCPEGHPLAKRNDLRPEQVSGEELLLLEDGHCLRDHALSICRLSPGQRAEDVAATSLHTLVHMVAGGLGVTLLPKLAAEAGVTAGAHVALCAFARPVIGRSIGVAWREGGRREAEARLLAEVLRGLF